MTRPAWPALTVDDVEAVPWRGTEVVWRPLRAALGLYAFGAYTAERVGQDIVELHVEDRDGRGHEELYIVLAGRAKFTLDGEVLDAPAGTLVHLVPAVHRAPTAAEVPTTVDALDDLDVATSAARNARAQPVADSAELGRVTS